MSRAHSDQSGNVLWFILIGIVLLGALTMMLSRGGSSVDQTGDYEKRSVQITEILRYAKGIESAVERMKLSGISENDISFENAISSTDYTNGNCSTDTCKVFEAAGGGQNYMAPKSEWLDSSNSGEDFYGDWIFTSGACISGLGTYGEVNCNVSGASALDLIMILPYIKLDLCKQMNDHVIGTTTVNPPIDQANSWPSDSATVPYDGDFSSGNTIIDTNNDLYAQPSGCFEATDTPSSGVYHFYHVLFAR